MRFHTGCLSVADLWLPLPHGLAAAPLLRANVRFIRLAGPPLAHILLHPLERYSQVTRKGKSAYSTKYSLATTLSITNFYGFMFG